MGNCRSRSDQSPDPFSFQLTQKYAIDTIANVSLFNLVTEAEEDDLEVREMEYKCGEDIVRQGEEIHKTNSWIFVIKEGRCEVLENDQRVNVIQRGDIVGERALLQNLSTRTATVRGIDPEGCKVIGISIRSLEKALGLEHELLLGALKVDGTVDLGTDELLKRLRAFPILTGLPEYQLIDLASKITVKRHNPGELIVRKNDLGEEFYLLDRGRIGILHDEPAADDTESLHLEGLASPLPMQSNEALATATDNFDDKCDGSGNSIRSTINPAELSGRRVGLFTAFKGVFTASQLKLHSDGVANAILSYASSTLPMQQESQRGPCATPSAPAPKTQTQRGNVKFTLSAGRFFGEAALLGDGKRGASIVALTHTTLLVLDRQTFARLMRLLEYPPSPPRA